MLLTYDQLISKLLGTPNQGAKQAALITRTKPRLTAGHPFDAGVERLALRQVTLGASYQNAVNRRREADALADAQAAEAAGLPATFCPEYFVPQALWNGKGVYHTKYTVKHVDYDDRIYFAVKPAQQDADTASGSVAVVVKDKWIDLATGDEIDVEAVRPFLPPQRKSRTQEVYNDVQWRTIALSSVVELHYGDVYVLRHPPVKAAPKKSRRKVA